MRSVKDHVNIGGDVMKKHLDACECKKRNSQCATQRIIGGIDALPGLA